MPEHDDGGKKVVVSGFEGNVESRTGVYVLVGVGVDMVKRTQKGAPQPLVSKTCLPSRGSLSCAVVRRGSRT